MKKVKYIYVVLVYKNIEVIEGFYQSIKNQDSYQVVVVDSFSSDEVRKEVKSICEAHGWDFVGIENKGYGYGNNVGTKYVIEHYDFDFLFISNSDIEIKSLDSLDSYKNECIVIAPKTVMKTGKHQNPDTPWELKFIYPMLSYALNHKTGLVYTMCHICTRLNRELFRLYACVVKKERYKIFSAHGSFIIFTKRAVETLYPFFDDEMFLYNEEWYLALKARAKNVPIYHIPSLEVLHLEGASSGSIVYSEHDRESFNILNYKRKNNLIK